jgi:hypothetical protein
MIFDLPLVTVRKAHPLPGCLYSFISSNGCGESPRLDGSRSRFRSQDLRVSNSAKMRYRAFLTSFVVIPCFYSLVGTGGFAHV